MCAKEYTNQVAYGVYNLFCAFIVLLQVRKIPFFFSPQNLQSVFIIFDLSITLSLSLSRNINLNIYSTESTCVCCKFTDPFVSQPFACPRDATGLPVGLPLLLLLMHCRAWKC